MAKTKISEFSATPANNTDIDSINISEGCAPSGINDAIRELMAQLKDFQTGAVGDSFNGPIGTSTAAAGAFTTLSASSTVTLSGGTANGVAYLNGSKVVTSGSALTFDGTRLTSTTGKFGGGAASNSASLMVNNATNTATGIQLFQDGIESWIMGMPANSAGLAWSASGSEQMRLTSTGLGIGTSSPTAKLDVNGITQSRGNIYGGTSNANANIIAYANVATGGAGTSQFLFGNTSSETRGYLSYNHANDNLLIGTAGATKATLDSSGNLGLGVTPSAWGFGGNLELPATNNISFQGAYGNINSNAYYDLSQTRWEYITSGYAAQYQIGSAGQHIWNTAGSGTAGNAISFTQAMTLDASGNLLVGATSNPGILNKSVVVDSGASSLAGFVMQNNATGRTSSDGGALLMNGTEMRLTNYENDAMLFSTNNTERARIDSSGNLLINTTSSGSLPGDGYVFIKNTSTQYTGHASGTASGTGYQQFWYNGASIGSITQNGTTGVLYNLTSDYRLKNNPIALTGSGEFIDALQPKTWDWHDGSGKGVGFIAHEFMEVAKYSGNGEKDAVDSDGKPIYQSIQPSSSEVMAYLVAEIQSLRKRLADAGL